ncbi:MAG: HEAT repeat domain-containing protein [Candidatus Latescibacteria bacterium]|jgi:hypothetical protein|nr:HEAT repeat domain-containing protein [Candidatus Latescibacterota bacterium]
MMTPTLLTDERMQAFLRDGYVTLDAGLPAEFHQDVHGQITELYASHGNPGNDILPRVPALHDVLSSPDVHGALHSLLGPDYLLHPHRHCHQNVAGSKGQRMHQDSYEADQNVRHHRARWLMAFYYPHDVDASNGPSSIVPATQYLTGKDQHGNPDELPVLGQAGTVTIVHYDLWHRATPNAATADRFMVKFLFTRMAEPSPTDWQHDGRPWTASGAADDPLCADIWDWYRGAESTGNDNSADDLECLLAEGDEMQRYSAAYRLGAAGSVHALISALRKEAKDRLAANVERSHTNPAQFDAAYGLTAAGTEALPALADLLHDEDWALRASAADILGDIGTAAADGVSALQTALGDESEWVRRNATEALGNIGPASAGAANTLAGRLTDDDVAVRHNAALALGKIGSAPVDALTSAAGDDDHYVSTLSAEALKRLR